MSFLAKYPAIFMKMAFGQTDPPDQKPSHQKPTGVINKFPDELLVQIFRKVHKEEPCPAILAVCQRWRNIYLRLYYHRITLYTEGYGGAPAARIFRQLIKENPGLEHYLFDLSIEYTDANRLARRAFADVIDAGTQSIRRLSITANLTYHNVQPLLEPMRKLVNVEILVLDGIRSSGPFRSALGWENLRSLSISSVFHPDEWSGNLVQMLNQRKGISKLTSLSIQGLGSNHLLDALLQWPPPSCLEHFSFYCSQRNFLGMADDTWTRRLASHRTSLKSLSILVYIRHGTLSDFSRYPALTHLTLCVSSFLESWPEDTARRMPPELSTLGLDFAQEGMYYTQTLDVAPWLLNFTEFKKVGEVRFSVLGKPPGLANVTTAEQRSLVMGLGVNLDSIENRLRRLGVGVRVYGSEEFDAIHSVSPEPRGLI